MSCIVNLESIQHYRAYFCESCRCETPYGAACVHRVACTVWLCAVSAFGCKTQNMSTVSSTHSLIPSSSCAASSGAVREWQKKMAQDIEATLSIRPSIPKKKLKTLFINALGSDARHECVHLLHCQGHELDFTYGTPSYGFSFHMNTQPLQWLAYYRGVTRKDLLILLCKKPVLEDTMPVWESIIKDKTNNPQVEYHISVLESYRSTSSHVFLITANKQYDTNCTYQSYCFSPGRTLPVEFIPNLLVIAPYSIGLDTGPRELLESYNIKTQSCVHLKFIAGRGEGFKLLHADNGYLTKMCKLKKYCLVFLSIQAHNRALQSLFLENYRFKILCAVHDRVWLIRMEYLDKSEYAVTEFVHIYENTHNTDHMLTPLEHRERVHVPETPKRKYNMTVAKPPSLPKETDIEDYDLGSIPSEEHSLDSLESFSMDSP